MTALTYDSRSQLRGVIAACVSATSFGVSITFATVAYAGGSDPLTVVAFRTVAGLLISLAIVSFVRRPLLPERNAMTPLMLMVAGLLFVNYGYNWSVHYIPISLAVLVFYTFPLIVLAVEAFGNWRLPVVASLFAFVLAYFMFGERLRPRAFAGAMLSIAGAMVIGWGDIAVSGMALLGDALALLGAALATGYFFAGYRARQHLSLNAYTFVVYATAAVVLLGYCAVAGVPLTGFAGADWGVFVALAVFPTLLGHSVFNWSMRWVSATVISVVVLCEPIGASALAWLIFGTLPQISHYIGGTGVLVGVLIFMRYRNPPPSVSGAG